MNYSDLLKKKDIDGIIEFFNENKKVFYTNIETVVPSQFKNLDDYKKFLHEFCIKYSIDNIKKEMNDDDLIGVYVNFLDESDNLINSWFERVFEFFTLFSPEASLKLSELKNFLPVVIDKKELDKEFNKKWESMGINLDKKDIDLLKSTKDMLKSLVEKKIIIEERLSEIVSKRAPNTSEVATPVVAARLISISGGLRRLMLMPSSTIQVLGAEKALFRHLRGRNKSRPPKHGVIFYSPYVSGVSPFHRGKMARALASKISICAKVDYFKGKSISKKLISDLDRKMKGLK